MGSDLARILSFSSLGHQSRFDVPPPAVCVNGHFASVDICSLSFGLWIADITYLPTWASFLYLAIGHRPWPTRSKSSCGDPPAAETTSQVTLLVLVDASAATPASHPTRGAHALPALPACEAHRRGPL